MVTRTQRRRQAAIARSNVVTNALPAMRATVGQRARRRRYRARRRERLSLFRQLPGEGSLQAPIMGSQAGFRAPLMGPTADITQIPAFDVVDGTRTALGINGQHDMGQVLNELGATINGQRWAFKALHPCGEEVTASPGIPDHVSAPVLTPEFRNDVVIGGIGSTTNDDVDIMRLPFADVPLIYRRYPAGSSTAGLPWTIVKYSYGNWLHNTTTVSNWTGVPPRPTNAAVPLIQTNLLGQYSRVRSAYSGVTVHLDAPQLSDQGRIVAGQVALPIGPNASGAIVPMWPVTCTSGDPSVCTYGNFTSALVPPGLEVVTLAYPPLNEQDLVSTCPGAYVTEAREGAYMPLRFMDPAHQFVPPMTRPAVLCFYNAAITGNYPTVAQDFTPRALPARIPDEIPAGDFKPDGAPQDPTYVALAPQCPLNVHTGIILLRGIDKLANVQIKSILGLEAMVAGPSEVTPFQHMAPGLDRMALDKVAEVSQQTPYAYPASYNDISSIIDTIGSILGVIGTPVRQIANYIGGSKIPLVNTIGSVVGNMLGGLGFSPGIRNRGRLRYMSNGLR